jgi:hypothetical protein
MVFLSGTVSSHDATKGQTFSGFARNRLDSGFNALISYLSFHISAPLTGAAGGTFYPEDTFANPKSLSPDAGIFPRSNPEKWLCR